MKSPNDDSLGEKNSKPGKPYRRSLDRSLNLQAGQEQLARHVSQLEEHFTSIQIIATRVELDGSTTMHRLGSGDIYARFKATELWLDEIEYSLGRQQTEES